MTILAMVLTRLRASEDGAVTVDWVVLTAAIVSLGMVVGGVIWGQTGGISEDVASFVGTQTVKTTF